MIDVWTFGRRYGMSYNAFLKHAMDFANFPWSFLSQPRPDFPGGAKKFCYLLNTWTRDLTGPQGMRHAFVQKGPHIICAQCRTSVASFCGDGYEPSKDQNSRRSRIRRSGISVHHLPSHKLRNAMRRIACMIGPCELVIVKDVMDA